MFLAGRVICSKDTGVCDPLTALADYAGNTGLKLEQAAEMRLALSGGGGIVHLKVRHTIELIPLPLFQFHRFGRSFIPLDSYAAEQSFEIARVVRDS